MRSVWKIDKDPSDELLNLERDGVLVAYPLDDEYEVAEAIGRELEVEGTDTLTDHHGEVWTVEEFLYHWH